MKAKSGKKWKEIWISDTFYCTEWQKRNRENTLNMSEKLLKPPKLFHFESCKKETI